MKIFHQNNVLVVETGNNPAVHPSGLLAVKLPDTPLKAIQQFEHRDQVYEWLFRQQTQRATGEIRVKIGINSSPDTFYEQYSTFFTVQAAAGGLVLNPAGQLLMIFRRGLWDLPKGKIDPGETPQQAALREVEEETGAQGLQLLEPARNSYHIFQANSNSWVLKPTYWFWMRTDLPHQTLTPQAEEQIEQVEWVEPPSAIERLNGSYASLKDLLSNALSKYPV